ncbi:uncharacterized protein LOC123258844 [Cotesia glomerata]|uniref:Uncharacterized protein n=1 Tax=Cotesia glomerata TaxID=32391 RepID=A0AAV7I0X2_COTGL|nr:uncharacterized protein LOC123258844 [Cotesia glomerata]KAH0539433.1 hypothetical protein KQX54_004769 [Cotesia glomerata]
MSGLFGVFCSLLLLSALEFTPSESLAHRQTRQTPDLNEGMDVLNEMAEATISVSETDMFAKVSEIANEFIKKDQEMGDQFMKPRRRRDTQSQELNLHRVARQIPGFDQAISTMKSGAETFVQTGSSIIQKVPEVASEFMNKAQQMGSQFMNPGRRRRSPEPKASRSRRCNSRMTTAATPR